MYFKWERGPTHATAQFLRYQAQVLGDFFYLLKKFFRCMYSKKNKILFLIQSNNYIN